MPRCSKAKREAVAAKFARVESALGAGPFFAGEDFSLVDAVFAPIFRYFDVFDRLIDLRCLRETPKVRAGGRIWRSGQAFASRSGPIIRNCCMRSWFAMTRTC